MPAAEAAAAAAPTPSSYYLSILSIEKRPQPLQRCSRGRGLKLAPSHAMVAALAGAWGRGRRSPAGHRRRGAMQSITRGCGVARRRPRPRRGGRRVPLALSVSGYLFPPLYFRSLLPLKRQSTRAAQPPGLDLLQGAQQQLSAAAGRSMKDEGAAGLHPPHTQLPQPAPTHTHVIRPASGPASRPRPHTAGEAALE